jgi:hypothetical protein
LLEWRIVSFCNLFPAERAIIQPIEVVVPRSHTLYTDNLVIIATARASLISQLQMHSWFESVSQEQEQRFRVLIDRMGEQVEHFIWDIEMNRLFNFNSGNRRTRTRRGDKHRGMVLVQPHQYYRNNNRIDHPTYPQRNKGKY